LTDSGDGGEEGNHYLLWVFIIALALATILVLVVVVVLVARRYMATANTRVVLANFDSSNSPNQSHPDDDNL
jgi:hypothetical protein